MSKNKAKKNKIKSYSWNFSTNIIVITFFTLGALLFAMCFFFENKINTKIAIVGSILIFGGICTLIYKFVSIGKLKKEKKVKFNKYLTNILLENNNDLYQTSHMNIILLSPSNSKKINKLPLNDFRSKVDYFIDKSNPYSWMVQETLVNAEERQINNNFKNIFTSYLNFYGKEEGYSKKLFISSIITILSLFIILVLAFIFKENLF